MRVEHTCCAGLDVHERTVVPCVLKGAAGVAPDAQTESFGTTTPELLEMVEVILAEAGTDMGRFLSAAHFASWIGLCPSQNESAGKRRSGKTRKGNRSLRAALVEAAHGAVRKKGSYFGAQYRRIATRRGKKKALIAVAHSLAVASYNILKNRASYLELGDQFFDNLNPARVLNRLTRRIQNLGFQVQLSPLSVAA